MTILIPYRGTIEIVGEHDGGKTLAALGVSYPYKKTVFIDDDVKGDATVKKLEEIEGKKREDIFADYIDLRLWRNELGKTPTATQLLEKVVDPVVERVCRKKYEVIIWDTGRIIYQSARGHVDTHQSDYRHVVNFRGSSQIIQGLVSRVARMIEQSYLSRLRDACEVLIVTHHIKDWYTNNVVVGVIPESSTTYNEICTMRMWLRRNPYNMLPTILFLKRPNIPSKSRSKSGRPRFINVVPPKITPIAEDESVWDAIARYEAKPVGNRELRSDETPNKEEMSLISGTLSDDQKSLMMEVLKHQEKEKETISGIIRSVNGQGIPSNGGELLAKAMGEFDMDAEHVSSVLEMETDDILTMESELVKIAWGTVKKFAEESGISD